MPTEVKKRATVSLDVRVPAKIAWRGITDSRELQIWFAQQASVDLKDDGQYQFGGKHVPFIRYEERLEQPIILLDKDKMKVSFRWPLRRRDGEVVDTEVHYQITEVEERISRLDVEHIVNGDDLTDDDLRNLWTLILNGYVFHMEGASGWVRPEFTSKKGKEFRIETWIAAKKDIVYQTLTTVDGIKGFFAPQVKEIKLEENGILDLGWDQLPIREIEENAKFVHGWREVAGEEANLDVCWELKEEGNGTRVSLTEGTFSDSIIFVSRPDYDGWAAVMNDLKRFVETTRHPIFLSILVEEIKA
ncbi:SRPBCC domain-containing protein [bacterium]|nr:SRPBCC domain-containing protein [bacterium]